MKKTKSIRVFLISFLFFATASIFQNTALHAQNLVPNPGFEEYKDGRVLDWRQTGDGYYHFDFNSNHTHSGDCINGLCDWGSTPTEYMQVQLKSTLVKDKKYRVTAYTRIRPGDIDEIAKDSVQFMGICFDKNPLNVDLRICLFQKPAIRLYVYKDILWHKTEVDYIATGEENYLTIGHFFDSTDMPVLKIDINYQNYLTQKEKLISAKNDEKDIAISKITKKYQHILAKRNDIGNIKNLRKRDRILNEYVKAQSGQKNELKDKLTEISDKYKAKINALALKNNLDPNRLHFTNFYRMYFDDISVEPAPEIAAQPEQIIPLNNVFFNTAEWILLPASFAELDKQVAYLKQKPNLKIEISGHTDNVGSDADNQLLSENRARAVVEYFIQNGIAPDRLTYKGYGYTKPIANNQTEEGRAKNRRVEMKIISE